MFIIHKGFRSKRAVSPASILGGKLIGLKSAIPYEIIHSPLLLAIALTCCSNNDTNTTPRPEIQGKWVEVTTRMDTLTFGCLDDVKVMTLGRGKEIVDDELLPKPYAGPYHYKIEEEEQIALRWMLSSNAIYQEYYFKISEDTLKITNFFGASQDGILTFEKLN